MPIFSSKPNFYLAVFALFALTFETAQKLVPKYYGSTDVGTKTQILFNGTKCFMRTINEDGTAGDTFQYVYSKNRQAFKGHSDMYDFEELASMPKCGLENYEEFKYCARTHFYGIEGLTATEPAATHDLFKTGNYKDNTLVLVDGCLRCSNARANRAGMVVYIAFIQPRPAGEISKYWIGVCEEDEVVRNNISITLDSDGFAPFVAGGIIWERMCPKSKDSDDREEPKLRYKGLKLMVQHTCNEANALTIQNYTLKAADLVVPKVPWERLNFHEERNAEIELK